MQYIVNCSSIECCLIYVLQQSPKASLTASPGEKGRSGIVTARSPNESRRIVTAKTPRIGKRETKTETKKRTKNEAAAMWNRCPTGVTVKIALVAM